MTRGNGNPTTQRLQQCGANGIFYDAKLRCEQPARHNGWHQATRHTNDSTLRVRWHGGSYEIELSAKTTRARDAR